jgi:hypothetical protein
MTHDDVPASSFDTAEELAGMVAHWIRDAECGLERLAAETGKPQRRTFGMEEQDTENVLLLVHLACEPGRFATRSMDGELAEFAARALGEC